MGSGRRCAQKPAEKHSIQLLTRHAGGMLLYCFVCAALPGAAQYTNSMITSIMEELTTSAFGNPHSRNPSSARSTQEVNLARSLVLQHFNADPDQYYVIFTK